MEPFKNYILTFSFLILFAVSLISQHSTEVLDQCQQIFEDYDEINVIIDRPSHEVLEQISKVASIDHGSTDQFIYLNIAEEQFDAFLEKEILFTIDKAYYQQRTLKMLSQEALDDIISRDPNGCLTTTWDFYPTYEAYLGMMQQFATDYPEICQLKNLGTLSSGREIIALKISDNVSERENEPKFLYTSTMHGDESAGYPLLLRLSDYLLCNYDADQRVTDLVNGIEIWINPLANPDGTYRTGNNSVAGASRRNANNVDLNRNFPDHEDGPNPDGNVYQEETLIFMELAQEDFNMSGNFHGGAEVFNYPWDTYERRAADNDWWICQGRMYVDTVHLHSPQGYLNDLDNGVTNGYDWYEVNGGRQDFMTHTHRGREFTLELSNQKLLDSDKLPDHWEYNYRSLLNYLEASTLGLRGVITDSVTGEPVEAEVFITGHDEDNSQVFSQLPHGGYFRYLDNGNYDVTYSAEGYVSQTLALSVDKTSVMIQDVVLVPESVSSSEISTDELVIYTGDQRITVRNIGNDKSLMLYTTDGKMLLQNYPITTGVNQIQLEVGILSGAYLIQISDGKRSLVQQVVF